MFGSAPFFSALLFSFAAPRELTPRFSCWAMRDSAAASILGSDKN